MLFYSRTKALLLLIIQILVGSCQQESKKETVTLKEITFDSAQSNAIHTETRKTDTTLNVETILHSPCPELQTLVAEIEKINWIPDTIRLPKSIDRRKFRYFNNYPFYLFSFQESRIKSAYISHAQQEAEVTQIFESQKDLSQGAKQVFEPGGINHLDTALFARARNIWAYFYREKNGKRDRDGKVWISSGVIEQWEFATEAEAKLALKQITKAGLDIFFNTQPYFCQIRNSLIIFHTRAMSFSLDQKVLFEKFVQENEKAVMR